MDFMTCISGQTSKCGQQVRLLKERHVPMCSIPPPIGNLSFSVLSLGDYKHAQ